MLCMSLCCEQIHAFVHFFKETSPISNTQHFILILQKMAKLDLDTINGVLQQIKDGAKYESKCWMLGANGQHP